MKALAKRAATMAADTVRGWSDMAIGKSGPLLDVASRAFDWAYGKALDGVPGFEGAEELAKSYADKHKTPDAAVRALINRHSGMAGAAGFVTGIGGFAALPVALPANLASALYIQVRLVAAIAHLRGHDIRSPAVRALALACLTGSKAAGTMKDAGVRVGTRLTRDAAGWVAPAIFKKAHHAAPAAGAAAAGGMAAGGVAKFGRLVPVVGGVIAGGVDAAMAQLIGRTADRVFSSRALAEKARPIDPDRASV